MYDLLSSLDATKASGHDDISARMLKETALSITPLGTHLFNLSIKLEELPDEWKTARVSPIPKSGNQSDARNYRPISLLSVLSKLLEKHIHNLLIRHFEERHSIFAQQWGFTKGKSTTGALLDATDQWFRLTSALYSLITLKLLTQFHIGLCYKSFAITMFIRRSLDGLATTFVRENSMSVLMAHHLTCCL